MFEVTPNAFIVGAPKAGTSALAFHLGQHPNVFLSTPKEPFFWCDDFPRLKEEMSIATAGDYLQLFANADPALHSVRLEGSTRYLLSERAIPRILQFCRTARIIVMVRNPIELVQAYHMEQVYSRQDDIEDFEAAWRAQDDRARGLRIPKGCREPAFLQYREVAELGRQVQRVIGWVPDDQLRVLLFDDLQQDVSAVYRDVLQFLGLPDDGRSEFPVVNPAHQHRIGWLANLVLAPPAWLEQPLLAARKTLWERRPPPVEWVKARLNVPLSRPPISDKLQEELSWYFQDDVALLAKLLQRDLDHWLR